MQVIVILKAQVTTVIVSTCTCMFFVCVNGILVAAVVEVYIICPPLPEALCQQK